MKTNRCHLRSTAIPSIFPWTTERCHTSVTSQIACSTKHRCDAVVPVDDFDTSNFDDNFCCTTDESHVEEDVADELQQLTAKIQALHDTITELSERLQQTEQDAMKSLFRYQNIERDDLVKFYTGFPDHLTLLAFCEEILESDAQVMRQLDGKRSKADYNEVKTGRVCKLALMEQFFMT